MIALPDSPSMERLMETMNEQAMNTGFWPVSIAGNKASMDNILAMFPGWRVSKEYDILHSEYGDIELDVNEFIPDGEIWLRFRQDSRR
jgi:hypothetical protein